MKVLRIREQFPRRSGGVRITSERIYRRYFRVLTDSDYAAAAVIIDTFAEYSYQRVPFENDDGTFQRYVPWIGDLYENANPDPLDPAAAPSPDEDDGDVDGGDPTPESVDVEGDDQAMCVDFDLNQVEDTSRWWDLMLLYTNRPEKDPEEFGADPTQRRIKVKWGSQTYEQYLEKDFSGRLIANSAGDPFDGYKTEYSYRVLTMTRYEKTGPGGWDPIKSARFENTINSAAWPGESGYGIGMVKCKSITADDLLWECGALYWLVTYTFHIRVWQPWDFRPLDAGYRSFTAASPTKPVEFAPRGQKPSHPVLLDGTGKLLNGTGSPAGGASPVYFDDPDPLSSLAPYQVFASTDFNQFSPPLSLPA